MEILRDLHLIHDKAADKEKEEGRSLPLLFASFAQLITQP